MKKLICILLTLAFVLGLCACNNGGGDEKVEGDLKVGFARESMMPETAVTIAGGEDPNRISTGAMEDITVSCVAMADSENTVLLYTIDMQCLTTTFLGGSKQSISRETGVPTSNIMLTATHNHGSPSHVMSHTGIAAFQAGPFQDALVEAGKKAMADLSPAAISIGETKTEGMVFVRHYEMEDGSIAGPAYGDLVTDKIVKHAYESDETVQVIKFARPAKDKKDVVLFNLGCHATYFSSTSSGKLLGSDFPGPARDYVEAQADCHAAYFMSASGDQTPGSRDSKVNHGLDYKAFGKKLGQYVVAALEGMTAVDSGKVMITQENVTAQSNKPDPNKNPARAVVLWSLFQKEGYDVANKQAREEGFKSIYECRSIVQSGSFPPTKAVNLNVISVGDIAFTVFSGEMFGSTGRYIRENSPYEMTFMATCANGYNGYFPDERGYEYGCYEAYSSYVAKGTAEQIGEKYIEMLKEHKGE